MIMKKLLSLIVTLLVASLFATSTIATNDYNSYNYETQPNDPIVIVETLQASSTDPFTIEKVEVEGVENPDMVNVERGDKLNIRVELLGHTHAEDVKVKAWIGGYEYEDVEDSTSLFDIEPNVTYVKNLVLEIPNDIDASKSYKLHIEAFNDQDSVRKTFRIQVEPQRHYLNFVDVIFNPGLSVKNTQPLFVTVRVENLGDKKEEDVRVEVSIPELGLLQRTFIDELVSVEDNGDDDEETSSSSDTLLLDLSNVQPGTYNLRVKVDYNRGHDFIAQIYPLTVTSALAKPGEVKDLIVQSVTSSMDLTQGGSATYIFSLANLGTTSRTFNFEVSGQEAWATAKLEPMSLTLLPDSTRDVRLTINAKSDADVGSKVFTVKVKEGSNVVKELQFDSNVKQQKVTSNLASLRSGLEIGFIVLLVILVILGIILAVNKMKGKEEGGETYY